MLTFVVCCFIVVDASGFLLFSGLLLLAGIDYGVDFVVYVCWSLLIIRFMFLLLLLVDFVFILIRGFVLLMLASCNC